MCSGSPWNAFFPPDLFITFSVHPAKKRIFYLRKGLSWPKWSFPVFCVVCIIWSHRAALLACQLGAGINFAFYSFVGAKHIYIFTKKKGCVFDERNFIFLIRKEPFHFFYQRLLGAYSAVIQKMSREQLLQACGRYFDDNWEATGTGRSWAAGMSSEKKIASDFKNWKQFWRNLQQFSRT